MPVETLARIEILWEEVILVSGTLVVSIYTADRNGVLRSQGQYVCNQPSPILPAILPQITWTSWSLNSSLQAVVGC